MNTIGKFQIQEKLGEGGAGEVYKCYDPDLQVFRAVKVPHDQSDGADKQLAEARLQAGIENPAVVRIHDVSKIDGKWVIVMDYAGGGSLNDKLSGGRLLEIDKALNYTVRIAGALSEAHQKNILHHDIKPGNILFKNDDEPLVADFGIARRIRENNQEMSRVMGTAEYIAPEQLEGRADLRSDIWALGVVLYEMLTGRSCFEGKTQPEILKKVIMERPAPLTDFNPAIPFALEKIVLRMLAKKPEERYQSMDDVIREIEAFRIEKWAEKRKPVRYLSATAILAFLIVCGAIYMHHTGLLESFGFFPAANPLEPIQASIVPAAEQKLAFNEQMSLASQKIDAGQYPEAFHQLSLVLDHAEDKRVKAEALATRAVLLLQLMDLPNRALADFKRLLQEYPDSPQAANAHYYSGWIYFEKKNDLKKAIQHLAILVDRYPDSPEAQTAGVLIQDADARLTREGTDAGLVVKSAIGGLLPNNWLSLLLSLISLIPLISIPIASILARFFKLEVDPGGYVSPMQVFRSVMRTPGLKTLVMIIVFSQILSFVITKYQSRQEFTHMRNSIDQIEQQMNLNK